MLWFRVCIYIYIYIYILLLQRGMVGLSGNAAVPIFDLRDHSGELTLVHLTASSGES